MLRLNSQVTVGNFRLPAITEIKIESSQNLLLDFASIEFLDQKRYERQKNLRFYKNGDKVEIKLSYNDNLKHILKVFLPK